MAQTELLVRNRMPRVLADIVLGYFESNAYNTYGVAMAGQWERTMQWFEPLDSLSGACHGGHIALARAIVNRINVELPAIRVMSVLEYGMSSACNGGSHECARQMIECGATDWDGGLMQACVGNRVRCARLMIDHGATSFDAALHFACANDSLECARLMIECGATDVQSASVDACKYGSARCAEAMFQLYPRTVTPTHALSVACRERNGECVRLAIKYGATACLACGGTVSQHLARSSATA